MQQRFAGLIFLLFFTLTLFGQQTKFGEEFKLKQGTTDMQIIHADASGVYIQEEHERWWENQLQLSLRKTPRPSLIKLDTALKIVFEIGYKDFLENHVFEGFYFLGNQAYVLGSAYNASEKTLRISGRHINLATGLPSGNWKELVLWQQVFNENKKPYNLKINYNTDSSGLRFSVVSTGEDNITRLCLAETNDELSATLNTCLKETFETGKFRPDHFFTTSSQSLVVAGKVFDYEPGKKQKEKNLIQKDYSVMIFHPDGSLVKNVTTDFEDKWLLEPQVLLQNGQILVTSFYTQNKKSKTISGVFIQRINSTDGNIISSGVQPLNSQEEESGDAEEALSTGIRFREPVYTKDGSILFIGEKMILEKFSFNQPAGVMYAPRADRAMGNNERSMVFFCDDLYAIKITATGSLAWMKKIPKQQKEKITVVLNRETFLNENRDFFNYLVQNLNLPFYSGVFSMWLPDQNKLQLIFNDHPKNSNQEPGNNKKPKLMDNASKSDCVVVSLDIQSGNISRQVLFNNDDKPTAMPRLGASSGNTFYFAGKEVHMFGKTDFITGKVSF